MSRLRIRPQARRDLLEIWQYIAKDNVKAANRLTERINQTLLQLEATPGIGHQRQDVADPRYRFHPVGKYVIAYRLEGNAILVVRIVHGARDFRRLFPSRG